MLNIDQLQHDMMVCLLGHQICAPNSGNHGSVILLLLLNYCCYYIQFLETPEFAFTSILIRGELVFTQKGVPGRAAI